MIWSNTWEFDSWISSANSDCWVPFDREPFFCVSSLSIPYSLMRILRLTPKTRVGKTYLLLNLLNLLHQFVSLLLWNLETLTDDFLFILQILHFDWNSCLCLIFEMSLEVDLLVEDLHLVELTQLECVLSENMSFTSVKFTKCQRQLFQSLRSIRVILENERVKPS